MKRLGILLVVVCVFFFFACDKEKELVEVKDDIINVPLNETIEFKYKINGDHTFEGITIEDETIAKYDNPELYGKSGLREYQAQKSKYCSKRTVNEEFDELIRNADFQYIFLSYNNEGLMSFDVIREIMEQYGEYEVFTTDYKRFRADKEENRNHKANKTTEYLHCLIKR